MQDPLLKEIEEEFDRRFENQLDLTSEYYRPIMPSVKSFLLSSCQRYHQEKINEIVGQLKEYKRESGNDNVNIYKFIEVNYDKLKRF